MKKIFILLLIPLIVYADDDWFRQQRNIQNQQNINHYTQSVESRLNDLESRVTILEERLK